MKSIVAILIALILSTQAIASSAINFDNVGVTAIVTDNNSDFLEYTPTFNGWSSNTAVSFFYKRSGDMLIVQGRFTVGSAAASEARVHIPSGLTIDSTKLATRRVVGEFQNHSQTNTPIDNELMAVGGNDYVTFAYRDSGADMNTDRNADAIAGAAVIVSVKFSVPITGWKTGNSSVGITSWQDYTPTTDGFGTITIENAQWRRVGDTLEIRAVWENGTVNANTAYMTIPSGLTIDTAKLGGNSRDWLGWMGQIPNGTASFIIGNYFRVFADSTNNDRVFFASGYSSNAYVKAAGSAIVNSSPERLNVFFSVPISGW